LGRNEVLDITTTRVGEDLDLRENAALAALLDAGKSLGC
jgi:hypothetical protein